MNTSKFQADTHLCKSLTLIYKIQFVVITFHNKMIRYLMMKNGTNFATDINKQV